MNFSIKPKLGLGVIFFYVQDERYFAIEHKDVRRETSQVGTAIRGVPLKVHH